MKKTLIIVTVITLMSACKRDEVVYEANYVKYREHDTLVGGGNFNMPYRDDKAAYEWFIQTEVYKFDRPRYDSFYVKYWGTYDEWKEMEKLYSPV
jgi:hypothetical protein